ncbi:unnamed protein product [Dibothriocephalus latus]|uniref:Uncharacterized protein n=1 Tax=Dibothriocephalus latus TaxID=60516 RepID=A0A3P7QA51_DIBLA|nr:unnamed protein product [Dibothriocephalus latus]
MWPRWVRMDTIVEPKSSPPASPISATMSMSDPFSLLQRKLPSKPSMLMFTPLESVPWPPATKLSSQH